MSSLGFALGWSLGASLGAPSFVSSSSRATFPGYFTTSGSGPSAFVQGDLEPDLVLVLAEARAGAGIQRMDLAEAEELTLIWKRPDGTKVERDLAQEETPGHVRWSWQAGDTSQVGEHQALVRITWPGGEVQTVPSDGSRFVWHVYETL